MGRLFLGMDSSTQSLSAVLVDLDKREVVYEAAVMYDEDLSEYGTRNGVLVNADPKVVHTPPLMWVEALDILFQRMKKENVPLSEVLAISGSGQQHGSVYMNDRAPRALGALDPEKDLKVNLEGIFSRETSPIWMDSSTSLECEEICESIGGMVVTAETTGSTTFERFTGPQIRKFHKYCSEAYADTSSIGLVSSFMASVLAGRVAPIDHGDGAGMNLMDIQHRTWNEKALKATAPDLVDKLPELSKSWEVVGEISQYFQNRFGFNSGARVIAWSGDNPNSVIGLGLIREGMVAISLGTSDTYFGTMEVCKTDPRGEGHVFVSPTGDYMSLICFKNGSLAREKICDQFGLDWTGFSEALRSTPPGNNGKVMLPYFEPEIVPNVLDPGVKRFDLEEDDLSGNCRAVVEAQMMSMRIHSEWMEVSPVAIYVTGGGSVNLEILQIMADVHECPVHRFEVTNSAALGAALRAAHGYFVDRGEGVTWETIVEGLAESVRGSVVEPDRLTSEVYGALVDKYRVCEETVVRG